mgnify:CR=1 FL=1
MGTEDLDEDEEEAFFARMAQRENGMAGSSGSSRPREGKNSMRRVAVQSAEVIDLT